MTVWSRAGAAFVNDATQSSSAKTALSNLLLNFIYSY